MARAEGQAPPRPMGRPGGMTREVPLMAPQATGHVHLRALKRGPMFYGKFRLNGGQTTRKIGPAWLKRGRPPEGYFTRATAEVELLGLMEEASTANGRPRSITFAQACDEWLRYLEQERGIAYTTLRHNRSDVNARLTPFFGKDTPVADITTERIDAYRVHVLVERGLSRSTAQKDLTHLSGILKRAKRLAWIDRNPYDAAERVKTVDSGDFNVLSVEEVEAVARAAASPQDAALYRVAAYTGLRQGELRALRWRDIGFAIATVHVRKNLPAHGEEKAKDPKSGKGRSVPLSDQAARPLDALSRRDYLTADDDRVFPSASGGALDDGDMRDAFYAALVAACLGHKRHEDPPIRFHDLRHTFGTLAVQKFPVTDVQAWMGHKDIKTTMRYAHHVPKHDAAARFSEFIAAQSVSPLCPEPATSTPTERNSAQLNGA